MKRILLSTAALTVLACSSVMAADLPPRMFTKAPQLVWDWTGFYLGAYAGVGAEDSRAYDPTGTHSNGMHLTGRGFNGGVTAGYNWQWTRNIVLGVEGDFGYLGVSHSTKEWDDSFIYNAKTSWLGTLRARAGWSSGPNLTYVTGGAAWVGVKDSVDNYASGITTSSSKTLTGYAVGTGVETMLGGGWTAKAESLYVDAGKGDTLFDPTYPLQVDKHQYQIQRFGLNYLFGAKPQPALPAYNWSGGYVGVVGGSALGQVRMNDYLGEGNVGLNDTGFTVGGIAGYNWQFAPNWVVGAEGDFSWLGIKGTDANYYNSLITSVKTSWIVTARARFGYSTGPAFLYVTGGGAWVKTEDTFNWGTVLTSSKTLGGYTVGAGIETVLAGNWVSRSDYLFVDVGRGDTFVPDLASFDHAFHLFRSALVYKF